MEEYIKYENRKVRRAYTRYRVSDHNLRIEKDRLNTKNKQDIKAKGIPQAERICMKCEANQVEDETHIFTCQAYSKWRDKYGINRELQGRHIKTIKQAKPNTMWYVYQVIRIVDKEMVKTPEQAPSGQGKPT